MNQDQRQQAIDCTTATLMKEWTAACSWPG